MRQTQLPRPRAASVLATVAVGLAVVSSGRAADEVMAPELSAALGLEPDLERGRIAYRSCAVCHGEDAGGRPDGTFPRLAGQHARVVMKQLVDVREGKRENPIMHPYAQRLMGAQEIADVAVWVSQQPRPSDIGMGPGTDLEAGQLLYGRECQSCHGDRGQGDAARFIPVLAGQHYAYLLREIREIGAGRRGNAHPEMAALVARHLDAELKAMVDYASRLESIARSAP